MHRTLKRAALLVAASAALVLAIAAPAAAHVTVNPGTAQQGGFPKLTFRVPNEMDKATTTTVEVDFPQDTPIPSVSVKPLPGWTPTVTTAKLATPIKDDDGNDVTQAVSKIVWKADSPAAAVQPGQFQEFDVSAGPLPKADQIVFKALQTYSDGTIVRWIEIPQAGQPEPEHPAPILKLTSGDSTDNADAAAAPSGGSSSGGAGVGLGIAALVLALAGLALGALAYRKVGTRSA
jgi:uncharacterized protein YcnI